MCVRGKRGEFSGLSLGRRSQYNTALYSVRESMNDKKKQSMYTRNTIFFLLGQDVLREKNFCELNIEKSVFSYSLQFILNSFFEYQIKTKKCSQNCSLE